MELFQKIITASALILLTCTPNVHAAGGANSVRITLNGASVAATYVDRSGIVQPADPTGIDTPTVRSFYIPATPVTVIVTVPADKVFGGWTGDTSCGTSLTCTFLYGAYGTEYVTALAISDAPVAAPAPAPTPKPVVTPTPVPATPAQPQQNTAPATPTNSILMVNNDESTEKTLLSYSLGEKITLSGKTTPKAKVHLFIHSDPREAEVIANDIGEWSYSLTDLEAGDHTIYAIITDTTSSVSSDKMLLGKFAVAQQQKNANEAEQDAVQSQAPLLAYSIAGVLLFTIIGIGVTFYLIRRRKIQSQSSTINLS